MAQAGSLTTITIGMMTVIGELIRTLPDGRVVVACNGLEWTGQPVAGGR